MKFRCILLGIALCFGASTLSAQKTITLSGVPEIDNSKVGQTHWSVEVPKTQAVKVGEEIKLTFTAQVQEAGWHLYSAQPSEEFAYMPTEFYLDPDNSKDVELAGSMNEIMTPKEEQDEVMGTIRFFEENKVAFSQGFKLTGKNPRLVGEIYGQVCLDPEQGGKCIPLRVPVKWNFTGN